MPSTTRTGVRCSAARSAPTRACSSRSPAYAALSAADLMRKRAVPLFDDGQPCGTEANMSKLFAPEASWMAANACLDTHGGFGFAAEYDVERKFRETRLYQVAPINNNLVLAYVGQNVPGCRAATEEDRHGPRRDRPLVDRHR
ncbi:MAG: acyl-CoA dehydrogenase family protein [Ilumatobacteraceae bacterium]